MKSHSNSALNSGHPRTPFWFYANTIGIIDIWYDKDSEYQLAHALPESTCWSPG